MRSPWIWSWPGWMPSCRRDERRLGQYRHRSPRLRRVRRRLAAAFGLAFVPVYLRLIGVEGFGLLGFYAALTTLLQVLDLGLSPTMNREMARYAAAPGKAGEARDFVRTVEVGYWGIGAVLGLSLAALAPWVAHNWLNPEALSVTVVQTALLGMAGLTFLQWPISLYQGGLLGLERQVPFNLTWITFTAVRHIGAWLVLTLSPSVVPISAGRSRSAPCMCAPWPFCSGAACRARPARPPGWWSNASAGCGASRPA